jgi:hypothetical protein
LLRAVITWLGILILAIANGGLREAVLIPRFGQQAGLVASGMLLALLVLAAAFATIRWIGVPGRGWDVGGLWLVLTLLFELSFGRLVQHKSGAEILRAYTFADGNTWPLVLLAVAAAPALARAVLRTGGEVQSGD